MDMEKYNEWPAKHKGDSNPSKEILKLGKKITDVAAHMVGGVNANDPEYWGLADVVDERKAQSGLADGAQQEEHAEGE